MIEENPSHAGWIIVPERSAGPGAVSGTLSNGQTRHADTKGMCTAAHHLVWLSLRNQGVCCVGNF